MNPAVFACADIHLRLGGRQILDGVSLAAAPAEVLGVVGPNGAGKTMLFEVLSGRQTAERGRVLLAGEDVTRLSLHARARRGLGRTYQSPVVPEELTVGEVLKVAREAHAPYLTRYHAAWATEQVGLAVGHAVRAGALETLNRRKLLLACLLMRRPSVLLMDEPAAGLIDAEIAEFDRLITYLARELGIAVILVEHRLELLAAIADRVLVLDLGRVIAEGMPETVFTLPQVRAAYFETDPAIAA
jgi:ABC-type branched-subunit amino acid transport system ATPase component